MDEREEKAEEKRLLEVTNEIEKILIENDVMGFITIASEKRAHWVWHTNTSWSCLYVNPDTGEARMRALKRDFKTKEQHHEVVEKTTQALFTARDLTLRQLRGLMHFCEKITKVLEVDHSPSSLKNYTRDDVRKALEENDESN